MKKVLRICIAAAIIAAMCTAFAFAGTLAAPKNVMQDGDSCNSVSIKWDANLNADGYQLRYANTKAGLSNAEIEECYSSISDSKYGLNAGKSYYVQVRCYTKDASYNKVPGAWSAALEVVTAPEQVGDNVIQTDATTSSITVKYPKVPGATGYVVSTQNVDNHGSSWKTYAATTKQTKTIKNLQKDSRYDVKVRAQRKSSSGYITKGGYERSIKNPYWAKTKSGKVSGLKVEYTYENLEKMSFKWKGKNHVDGYQIEMYNYKTGKTEKKLITNGYSDSSDSYEVNPKTFYKIRIRSYVTMGDDTKKFSEWGKYNYVQLQQKVKGTQSGRKVKVRWKKVSGATNYTVYVAKSSNGTFHKCTTTPKTSYTIKKCGSSKLKKGKTYYIMVVANKKVGSKTYHGTRNACQSIYLYKN